MTAAPVQLRSFTCSKCDIFIDSFLERFLTLTMRYKPCNMRGMVMCVSSSPETVSANEKQDLHQGDPAPEEPRIPVLAARLCRKINTLARSYDSEARITHVSLQSDLSTLVRVHVTHTHNSDLLSTIRELWPLASAAMTENIATGESNIQIYYPDHSYQTEIAYDRAARSRASRALKSITLIMSGVSAIVFCAYLVINLKLSTNGNDWKEL